VTIQRYSASGPGFRIRRGHCTGVDFAHINAVALPHVPDLVVRWLPDGHREGRNWVAINPRRADRHAGSFSVNLDSGLFADFASGGEVKGGDIIALYAYLNGVTQGAAARAVAELVGVRV
jgi:hypothetical protein